MNLYAYTTGDPVSALDPSGFMENNLTNWETRNVYDDEYKEAAEGQAKIDAQSESKPLDLSFLTPGKITLGVSKTINYLAGDYHPIIGVIDNQISFVVHTGNLVDQTITPEYNTTADHIHHGAMWMTKLFLSKVSPGAAITLCVIDYLVTKYGREYMVKVLTEVYGRDAARDLEMIYVMEKTRDDLKKVKREVQDEMDEFYAQLEERDKEWEKNREQIHLQIMNQGAGIDDGLNGCSVK